MSWLGLLLVLAAAFCHATWNFFVKRIGGGPELVWLFSFGSVVLYFPLAIYVFTTTEFAFGLLEAVFVAGSVVLHLGYFLLLQQGYQRGDLSIVYPTARATGPVLAAGFAVGFLGESLSFQVFVGGLIIIGGVFLLTSGFKEGGPRLISSVAFGLGAGVLIGSYTVWDAYAVSILLVPPLLLEYLSNVSRSVLLAPYAIVRRTSLWRHWREHRFGVLCIAVLSPLAYILVLYALTFTPVVYVAPVREVSVLVGVFMGSIILGEGHLRRRLACATVIFSGVATLATG